MLQRGGLVAFKVCLPVTLLRPGHYSVTASTGMLRHAFDVRRDALAFRVLDTSPLHSVSYQADKRPGMLRSKLDWEACD